MSRMRAKVSYVNTCQFTALRFEGKSCRTVVIIILTSDFACDVMLKIDRFGVSLNAKDTMLKYIPITIVIILTCLSQSEAQYDDKRCKCICPSLSSVINTTQSSMERLAYIINVPPLQCKCENVVLPKIGDQIKGKEEIFCPRCDCKYENRNTTIIKIVVIIVIWVISLLVIYMLFLICLDPLLNKRIHKASANIGYHEHNNEDDDSSLAPGTSHPMGERGNVLNRVGHQQDKWKRQVREQRRNIYDRHTMLN